MLKEFCKSWNAVYKGHEAEYHAGSVTIVEKGKLAKNKSLTLNCGEAVSFPSKQFDGYDMFSALTNRNCDGAFLVTNEWGTYDLVFIEMKSRFDSHEVLEAKSQITETRAKIKSLFQMMKIFPSLHIRNVLGVIETKQLDEDQENLWLKLQMLPDESLDFGWKLFKYGVFEGMTHFDKDLNMPSTMTFSIILSDNDHYTINYSAIPKKETNLNNAGKYE